jgi:carboxyl-terminal processing protease
VTVYSVIPGSPGDEAGLLEGDEIVSIDGREVADIERMEEIFEILRDSDRKTLQLEIIRKGRKSSVSLLLKGYI